MDCIYQTNQFKLFLLDIIECTALNTIYYVEFLLESLYDVILSL